MGDRGEVYIEDEGVYLYTHWGSHRLTHDVALALAERARWGHPSYLARIIFSQMLEGASDPHTGYGISTIRAGDANRRIHVDCGVRTDTDESRIAVTEVERMTRDDLEEAYDDGEFDPEAWQDVWDDNMTGVWSGTFEEFIEHVLDEDEQVPDWECPDCGTTVPAYYAACPECNRGRL